MVGDYNNKQLKPIYNFLSFRKIQMKILNPLKLKVDKKQLF